MFKEKAAFTALFWVPAIGLWWFFGVWVSLGFWVYSCLSLAYWRSTLNEEELAYWKRVGVMK
jgi:hypothetical protein